VGDEPWPDGSARGWADRVAEVLAARTSGFRYANLAVSGKLVAGIVAEQIPLVERMRPELVTYCGGGNDVLRPGCRPSRLADAFEAGLERLVATGAEVVVFTGFDPIGVPLIGQLRGVISAYNERLRAAAARHGCRLVDLWPMLSLQDPRAWSEDRLHMSPAGHELVTAHALEVLGLPTGLDWRAPWPPLTMGRTQRWRADLRWGRAHFAPWVMQRVRGRTPGYDRAPKRPLLTPVTPAAAQAYPTDA
jgi:lysophospholipase L1-like esterase